MKTPVALFANSRTELEDLRSENAQLRREIREGARLIRGTLSIYPEELSWLRRVEKILEGSR